jgi:serine/threonine protein kinase
MTPERWQKVRDILEQALELGPEKRGRFLDVVCAYDRTLRSEVESLLSADGKASSGFLDSPLARSTLLSPGMRLGDYEIVSQIGSGGMGMVYQARDLRLSRFVAIKVLREHVSADEGRLRRFEQEAQATAALNHPNILAVYQLGVYQGAPYLVSELLEGETLRVELKRGALAQSRAIELGEQIAEGLGAAHQRGVIHRDLKPENLFVSKDGRIKILDFGLAKLLEEDRDPEATVTAGVLHTNQGMIPGTVGYVSPEQVRGEKVDARTDLFSFGIVLYEMATGLRPFTGGTSAVTYEAILNREPTPPSQVNSRVAPELERIIFKALEKDREVRYQSVNEIRADLKRLKRDLDAGRSPAKAKVPLRPAGRGRTSRLVKVAAFALLLGALWFGYPAAKTAWSAIASHSARDLHAQIDPPPLNSFRLTGDNAGPPVISPNGGHIVFSATGQDGKFKLWLRALNAVDARALPETDNATFPFWSPDSSSVGFFADGKLKTINVAMGSPVALCEAADGRGGTWSANGDIVFSPSPTSPLLLVKAAGGTPQPVTRLEGAAYTTHRWPFVLPDNEHFLYLAANHEPSKANENMIFYASLDGRENHALFQSDSNAIFANGLVLYAHGDNLLARGFDPEKGEATGEPRLVARRVINDNVTWHADVSASDAGLLLYGGAGQGSRKLVWLDRKTYAQIEVAVDGLSQLFLARLSPDGNRVAMQMDHDGRDVSIYDLQNKITLMSLSKLNANTFPAWSGDSRWVMYTSLRDGKYRIYRIAADGNGEEEELLGDEQRVLPIDMNGSNLLYLRGGLGNEFECWAYSLATQRRRKVLDSVDVCAFSPDGHWLTYAARETLPVGTPVGPLKVYVVNFDSGQGKYQASESSGIGPQWSRDGKQLYYMEQTTLTFVSEEVKFTNGVPRFRVLDRSPNVLADPIFGVSPDKKRILIERIPEPTVVVVTNFSEALPR